VHLQPKKIVAVAFLSIAGAIWLAWHFLWAPRVLWAVTYEGHLLPLSEAVIRFSTKYDRLPTNVVEMVSVGVLPRTSTLYFSPITHESVFPRTLPFDQSDFVMEFSSEEVRIKIPHSIYAEKRRQRRFNWLGDDSLTRTVAKGTKFG
jgi:hypothetical protein